MRRKNHDSVREIYFLMILIALVYLSGCTGIRSSLDEIDRSYKQGFYEKHIMQNQRVDDLTCKDSFIHTLNLIDLFIMDYKDRARDAEMAHVKVLQSLIFLQRGEYDRARLAIKLAEDYTNNIEERDRALIGSLPDIIWGWQISEEVKRGSNRNRGKLKGALEKLQPVLDALDKKDYKVFLQKGSRGKGGGEIYLYLTAVRSILHHNRNVIIKDMGYREYARFFHIEDEEHVRKQVKEDYEKGIEKMRELLQELIPDNELNILDKAIFTDEKGEVGISMKWFQGESKFVRYKALYLFLKNEAQKL